MNHRKVAERTAKGLLLGMRKKIEKAGLDPDDFPRWIYGTNIRLGRLNNTTIIFFEQGPSDNSEIVEYRDIDSDAEFFFPDRHSTCESVFINIERGDNEEIGFSSMSNLTLSGGENTCFTNSSSVSKHLCFLLYNVMVQFEKDDEIIAIRHVPFALFVPDQALELEKLWGICQSEISTTIGRLYQLEDSNHRTGAIEDKALIANVEDTVIVLGSYDSPYETELMQVRDYLRRVGYDAVLIKDLPELPEQSLPDKVRLWTTASRFCVMVDREASGHIKEYEMVKSQHKPLIMLRPEDSGSTWMIGDDEIVDLNYVKTFEFSENPLAELEGAIQWVEDLLSERGRSYPEFYPWK